MAPRRRETISPVSPRVQSPKPDKNSRRVERLLGGAFMSLGAIVLAASAADALSQGEANCIQQTSDVLPVVSMTECAKDLGDVDTNRLVLGGIPLGLGIGTIVAGKIRH